jgi:hypothetical protein
MKKIGTINWNKAVKNSFYSVAFVALSLLTVLPSAAHAGVNPKNPPAEIKYVGSLDERPVFQIRLDNPGGEDLYLTLNDENGNLIYSDIVKGEKYTKNILLENLDGIDLKVNLILRNKKSYQTQTFQINSNAKVVEDVQVTKVK